MKSELQSTLANFWRYNTVDDALRAMREAVTAAENHQRELMEAELSRVRQQARAEATEQCAIEAGERSPEGVSSHTMLGDMWDKRIRNCRAPIPAEVQGGPTYGVAEFNEHVESRVSERTQASLGVIELAAKGVKPLTDENDQRWSVAYLDVVELSERTTRLREALDTTVKALHRELEYGLVHWKKCNPTYPACSCGASQARAHAIDIFSAARRALESE